MDNVNNNEETDVNGQDASTPSSQETDTTYSPPDADEIPQTGLNLLATALANFAILTFTVYPIRFCYTPASDLVLNHAAPQSADDLSFETWVTILEDCGLISRFVYNTIMYCPDAESMTPIRNDQHFLDAINDALVNSKTLAMFQILPVANGA